MKIFCKLFPAGPIVLLLWDRRPRPDPFVGGIGAASHLSRDWAGYRRLFPDVPSSPAYSTITATAPRACTVTSMVTSGDGMLPPI